MSTHIIHQKSPNKLISLIECPRDAMQGRIHFIPTQKKIQYLNALLKVGFDTLDFGSFVSPKAIPQMADTKEVIGGLKIENAGTKLLAIVANHRGAEEAVSFDSIQYIGYPFSISPSFQRRNTNCSMQESVNRVDAIQELCIKNQKQLVLYLSMGFGNPYGDEYNEEILLQWADEMISKEIKIISLADTVGVATAGQISFALNTLIPRYPGVTVGVHLHSTKYDWQKKIQAAIDAGCKRLDGTLKGIGGCPMAQDDLVGNMDSLLMIPFLEATGMLQKINHSALAECCRIADEIFF